MLERSKLLYCTFSVAFAAWGGSAFAGVRLTTEEQTLARLINEYRVSQGLPAVPLSSSLSQVAQIHTWDIATNHPDTGTGAKGVSCNLHSWSNKGNWSPICFTGPEGDFMWSKPRELTSYTSNGFEISAGGGGGLTPEAALNGWKSSGPHNDVILNQGPWTGAWQAMGVGMYQGYAHVWFGEVLDAAGAPEAAVLDPSPSVASNKFYRLKNLSMEKENKCLEGNQLAAGATLKGAAFMDNCQAATGQAWFLIANPDGHYRITNAFLAGANKCLEGNSRTPGSTADGAAFMADCQNVSGQKWKITPQGGHGYFQMTTQYQEANNKCFESSYLNAAAKQGGPAFLGDCQNFSRQLWKLEEY